MAIDIKRFGTADYNKDHLGNHYCYSAPLGVVLNRSAVNFIIKRGVRPHITQPSLIAQFGNSVYNMSDNDTRKISVKSLKFRSDLLENAGNPSTSSVSNIVVIDATQCSDKVKRRLWLWSINSLLYVLRGSGKYEGLLLVSRTSADCGVMTAAVTPKDEPAASVASNADTDALEMQIKKTKQHLAELEAQLARTKKSKAAREIIDRAQAELDELYGSGWSELCGLGWKLVIERAE